MRGAGHSWAHPVDPTPPGISRGDLIALYEKLFSKIVGAGLDTYRRSNHRTAANWKARSREIGIGGMAIVPRCATAGPLLTGAIINALKKLLPDGGRAIAPDLPAEIPAHTSKQDRTPKSSRARAKSTLEN